MFTGIVYETAKIVYIQRKKNFYSYTIRLSSILSKNLKIGDSVSNNGCCLTVKSIDNVYVSFDIINSTLKKTNLGDLNIGSYVNIEKSMTYGNAVGGHIISGHVIDTVEISKIFQSESNYSIWLKIKEKYLMKYVFYKGFICLDGISLTVGDIINNEFCVHLIPETLSRTTIKNKDNGSLINLEIDFYTQIIVDTTERLINQKNNIFHIFK